MLSQKLDELTASGKEDEEETHHHQRMKTIQTIASIKKVSKYKYPFMRPNVFSKYKVIYYTKFLHFIFKIAERLQDLWYLNSMDFNFKMK